MLTEIRKETEKELLSKILELKKDTIDLTNCKIQDLKNGYSEQFYHVEK